MSANPIILAPSLLGGDHARLADSVREIENVGAEWVHLDIMDGRFAPNLAFGTGAVAALRPLSKLCFDTHLMLERPDDFLKPFAEAGANRLTIHIESEGDTAETLDKIKRLGLGVGLTLNPDTPIEKLKPHLGQIDLLLIMTVQPGFGGQSFRQDMLEKIEQAARWREELGLSYRIQVDGGVGLDTAPLCIERGADTLVAGAAFFKAESKQAFADKIVSHGRAG